MSHKNRLTEYFAEQEREKESPFCETQIPLIAIDPESTPLPIREDYTGGFLIIGDGLYDDDGNKISEELPNPPDDF